MTCRFDRTVPPLNSRDELPSFTSVGAYPIYYVTEAMDVLCAACATEALWQSADSDYQGNPLASDVNWEDPELYCECGERIESAYAEKE